jgi:hypothetical protein
LTCVLQLLLLLLQVLPLVFLQLRPAILHRQLPLEVGDLALEAHDGLDLVLDLVDHPALDRLGELDLADQRDTSICARIASQRALRYFRFSRVVTPLAVSASFSLRLLGRQPRLADRVDLAEDLLLAVVDLLVGQLFVDERDELADAALVVLQLIAHLHDHAGDRRRARDRLDDGELAALDALGDLDLAFAREQRDGAHLAEVHPDRIVRLVERAGRQIELELLGAFAGAIEQFLFRYVFSSRRPRCRRCRTC